MIPFLKAAPAAPKTTSAVLAAFRSTMDELKIVQEQHNAIADEKRSQAMQLQNEADLAVEEARAASSALGKLQSVFG
jgi:hypothetical protein